MPTRRFMFWNQSGSVRTMTSAPAEARAFLRGFSKPATPRSGPQALPPSMKTTPLSQSRCSGKRPTPRFTSLMGKRYSKVADQAYRPPSSAVELAADQAVPWEGNVNIVIEAGSVRMEAELNDGPNPL